MDDEPCTSILHVSKKIELGELRLATDEEIADRRTFWKDTIKEKKIKNVVAPMVDQSELAFRMMLRAHGADLAYTPMIHAHLFVTDTTYRRNIFSTCEGDRPLIVQFCANDPDTFRDACRLVEGFCDGVDLNLGCPQNVARRGHYGAFLQDEVDLICSMISAAKNFCRLPISAKIRIKEGEEETAEYARRIVDAGASLLTVHGRTREMKGGQTGLADWGRIRQVVQLVHVPVFANGNVQMGNDVDRCVSSTGAVGVMSAEGILYNPYLFEGSHPLSYVVALEYLDYAKRFESDTSAIRAHVFRICHHSFLEYADLRQKVSIVHTVEEFREVVVELGKRVEELRKHSENIQKEEEAQLLFAQIADGAIVLDAHSVALTPHWLCKPYMRLADMAKEREGDEKSEKEKRKEELRKLAEESGVSMRQLRKRERREAANRKTVRIAKKIKFASCMRCSQPSGQGCTGQFCRKCCRWTCKAQSTDCPAHRYHFRTASITSDSTTV